LLNYCSRKYLLQQLQKNIIFNIQFLTGLTHEIMKYLYFYVMNTSVPFVVSDVSKQDMFFKKEEEKEKCHPNSSF